MNKKIVLVCLVCLFFLITGCSGVLMTTVKLDPGLYVVDNGEKEMVPTVCKGLYDSAIPKVAIVPFVNNTTFDYAQEVQSHVEGVSRTTVRGGAAVQAEPGGAKAVWGVDERNAFIEDTKTTQRSMNAKLTDSIEDSVMDQLTGIPGLKVYARKDLKQVFAEQQLQQSGMVDEATTVKLGKLVGVRYIVTGSFNNIVLSYRSTQALQQGSRDVSRREGNRRDRRGDGSSALLSDLAGAIVSVAAEAMEGWILESEIMVRVLDVESGQVIFSKKLTGKQSIGKMPYPGFDAVVGGVKKAASANLKDLRPALAKNFTTRGYIYQTKTSPDGKQRIALINLGKNNGLQEGSELIVYSFSQVDDPIGGKQECDQAKLPVTLKVTEQLQADKAWTLIDGNSETVKRIKIGQLVETRLK